LNTHDFSQINMAQRACDRRPLDRTTWLSLWRPYWLAKRCLPEWLPIAPSLHALDAL
jgi:hypothetical protein